MFLNGASPLVMCSGWSEKAFTNATSFFSRSKRTIKASCDKADTLMSLLDYQLLRGRLTSNLSACNIMIPVNISVGSVDCSMSTIKICDVTEKIPPRRYSSCLPICWCCSFGESILLPRLPIYLKPENRKARASASQKVKLFPNAVLFFWGSIHETHQ